MTKEVVKLLWILQNNEKSNGKHFCTHWTLEPFQFSRLPLLWPDFLWSLVAFTYSCDWPLAILNLIKTPSSWRRTRTIAQQTIPCLQIFWFSSENHSTHITRESPNKYLKRLIRNPLFNRSTFSCSIPQGRHFNHTERVKDYYSDVSRPRHVVKAISSSCTYVPILCLVPSKIEILLWSRYKHIREQNRTERSPVVVASRGEEERAVCSRIPICEYLIGDWCSCNIRLGSHSLEPWQRRHTVSSLTTYSAIILENTEH